MSPNGLRRWRRYAKKCRYRSRKEGKVSNATGASLRALFFAARIHPNYAVPPKPFTSRSIVGMTQGSRKRAIARCEQLDLDPVHRLWFRLGQRLRPCPGCPKCGVLRFERIGGFGDNTACVGQRVSTGTSRLIRSLGIPWRYSRDRRRSKSAPFHPLNRCMELVDAGQWTLGPELCDGSGVLPARRS